MDADAGRKTASSMRIVALTLIALGALVLFSGCAVSSSVGRYLILLVDKDAGVAVVFDSATGDFEARNLPLLGDPRDPGFECQAHAENEDLH